jgi:hypothetical protein
VSIENLRRLVAKAIGTFALVFAGCGAIMVLPDVRDHGRRYRHPCDRRGGGDRGRRHCRARRDVRRPGQLCLDESCSLDRPALVSGDLDALLLYIVAQICGASLAALAYQFVRGEQTRPNQSRKSHRSRKPAKPARGPDLAGLVVIKLEAVEITARRTHDFMSEADGETRTPDPIITSEVGTGTTRRQRAWLTRIEAEGTRPMPL